MTAAGMSWRLRGHLSHQLRIRRGLQRGRRCFERRPMLLLHRLSGLRTTQATAW